MDRLKAIALFFFFLLNTPASGIDHHPTPAKDMDQEIQEFLSANKIQSLDDYVRWVEENLTFTSDEKQDSWATPQETIRKRGGDCEDLAFLNTVVLQQLGYEAKVIAVARSRYAHAMCLFKKDGRYHVFDNLQLKSINASTLPAVAHFFFNKHAYSYFLELNLQDNKWQVVYQKKS